MEQDSLPADEFPDEDETPLEDHPGECGDQAYPGGNDGEGSDGDQVLWKVNPESATVPENAALIYRDAGLFFDDEYDAGIRKGPLVTHDGKTYYFSDLLKAANDDEIDSSDDFKDFLKKAKKHYRYDSKLVELRRHLVNNLDKEPSRELLRLLDKHYFKTGIHSFLGDDSNAEVVKKYVDAVKDSNAALLNILGKIATSILENYAVTIRDAKLIDDSVIGTITTVAVELDFCQILVARGDGTLAVFQSASYKTKIDVKKVTWKHPKDISIPGLTTPNLADLASGLSEVSTYLSTASAALEALHGALSEDSVDQLSFISGVLSIGAEYAPPGVSDLFEFYKQAVDATQSAVGSLVQESTITNANTWIKAYPNGPEDLSTIYLGGGSDLMLSAAWLKAKCDYFNSVLPYGEPCIIWCQHLQSVYLRLGLRIARQRCHRWSGRSEASVGTQLSGTKRPWIPQSNQRNSLVRSD